MGHTLVRAFALLLLCLSAPAAAQDGPKELRIVRITPTGEDVASVRQIVLEFNRPVVPVGDMARTAEEIGISIEPKVDCQWRWLNTTSLSCNLAEKESLKHATAYKLRIEPVIKAEDGATIAAAQEHSFTTQRPRADEAYIRTWKTPGTPQFWVRFNQPVTQDSVAAHIYIAGPDDSRMAVNVEDDDQDDRPPVDVGGKPANYGWLVTPQTELPLNSRIVLRQEKGLVSSEGPETGTTESDIREAFTFPEFSFRGVVCRDKDGKELLLAPGTPQTEEELCNPMQPIALSFTSPVLRSEIVRNLDIAPALGGNNPDAKPWGEESRDWSRLYEGRSEQAADFRINFPIGLKAAQDYTIGMEEKKYSIWEKIRAFFKREKLPSPVIVDEFGRTLPAFSFKFATGHRNPNYEIIYNDAVLEKGIDSEVPLYVNNLKQYSFSYNYVNADGADSGETGNVTLPDVIDLQYAVPAGVREMLGGKSGAVYATLQTSPSVEKYENANRFFAQVTPYQVYAKLGHYRSSVWVTDLATGNIVKDAKVTVYKATKNVPAYPENPLATAQTDENGLAFLPGTETLDPDQSLKNTYRDDEQRLFIRVDKGEDMALLPVAYEYEVQLWNIATDMWNDTAQKFGHMKSWGMTAQGIYRAGDTMQYKIYVRDQDNNRFIAPPVGKYALEITDPTGKSVEKIEDVKLSEFGTLQGEYKIPKSAAVGWYSFKLSATLKNDGKDIFKEFYPLSVLVSDFTPSLFRTTTELNGDRFKAGDKLDIITDAKLHSGGPFGNAAVRSTINLVSRPFISKDPNAKDFRFDSYEKEDDKTIFQKDDKLNDNGEWKTTFNLPEEKIVFGQIVVEGSVRDERGKSVASEARADYIGVDRLVGLKNTAWVYESKKPATLKTIVVDETGKPVSGVKVDLTIEKEEVVTAKVKSAGSAYLGDNTVEWVRTADCTVKSANEGQDCIFTPGSAGTYRVTAAIKDTKGRSHTTTETLWVSGGDYVQWNEDRNYALTIIPEKTEYNVGDVARYLVKNPYPGAMALVSVERYGVLDTFTQKLDGSTPIIEVPVKADYTPGFYVSVVAISPRVDAPPPEMGQIDMGKPAFRAGYIKTNVADPYKQMRVTAKADQDVYRPRDIVKVSLNVKPLNAPEAKEPFELAVAVLDESVFDLIAEKSGAFDPYKGFYALDALDVSNYSLMTRLLGRQKFEKKGANPGGDGGVDAGMRNIFKFVSYWNPSVPVDANGNARVEFEAPDNLTGWRILALAVTPNDRMGLGEGTFKVNRPTEIRPVMPNQVREGDEFSAGFSVMNRTDKKRDIKVVITASGDLEEASSKEETVTLEPYKRATVYVKMKAKNMPIDRDLPEGKIAFSATAGDAEDSDGLEHTLPVYKTRTIETAANYGTTTENKVSENIAVPKDIYTDTGDISVTLSPTVIAGLDGAFKFMRDYPYPCWEQKLSVAAMASHYKNLKPYLDDKTTWEESERITQDILDQAASYQAPNGGMAYFIARDEYVDPYLSAYTALAFQWLKSSGYKIPTSVEAGLQKYLLAFLRNNSAPAYYDGGMTSTVRAVILSAYKDSGKITKDDVLRFRKDMKQMSLFGKAHYLQAASHFPQTQDAANETLNQILATGVESGGKFSFNETYSGSYERILSTPLRDNCAVLSALVDSENTDGGDKAFKLVRMITQARGKRDHFENTQENMFCMNALVDYARKFESEEPDMAVAAAYDGKQFGSAEFKDMRDKPVTVSRPISSGDEGTKGTVSIDRQGDGRLYYSTRLRYAPKNPADQVNAGIDIRREYSVQKDGKWTLASSPVDIKRGDLVRVDLYVSVPTARSFVVVNDPLPGGLETVNRDLATTSNVDAAAADFDAGSYVRKYDDWIDYGGRWSFYHQELRHDSARFYSDWLEPGNYHLSYLAQAVATGTFAAPPVKAEEMYDPDVYGLGTKGTLVVKEAP